MYKNGRLYGLDAFKWIAVLLVVANHTDPLETLWEDGNFFVVHILSRIAVPFFLMVTGFFTLSAKDPDERGKKIRGRIRKTAFLYLAVSALYLPVLLLRYRELLKDLSGAEAGRFTIGLLRAVFFDGTYYHLWYLPAVMLGLIVTGTLLRLGEAAARIGCIILYAAGLLGDSYYGLVKYIPALHKAYEAMFCCFSYTRNGLFMAPLFLFMGYRAARRYREESVAIQPAEAVLSAVFMSAEGLLVRKMGLARWDSMYVFLPIVVWHLFLLLMSVRTKKEGSSFFSDGPMLLYFIHPMTLLFLRAAGKRWGMERNGMTCILRYVSVVCLSLLLTRAAVAAKDLVRGLRGRRA